MSSFTSMEKMNDMNVDELMCAYDKCGNDSVVDLFAYHFVLYICAMIP